MYKDRTIRLDFPELGEGCHVVIKNPALLPLEMSAPIEDGLSPEDRSAAILKRAKARTGALVVSWLMWDITAEQEEELDLPSVDPSVLDRCPGPVLNRIADEIAKRTNPQ